MKPIALLKRALDSFEGDIDAGVIENVDPTDIELARRFLDDLDRRLTFAENQPQTDIDPRSLHLLVELAHQQPHLHAYKGQEVGHHRLYAMLASGQLNAGDPVRCGLGSAHPPHEWLEAQLQVFTCEGASN